MFGAREKIFFSSKKAQQRFNIEGIHSADVFSIRQRNIN